MMQYTHFKIRDYSLEVKAHITTEPAINCRLSTAKAKLLQ
jgi:hypothetical protein